MGSNLGDAVQTLRHASAALAAHPAVRNLRVSSLYRSEPEGPVPQAPFVNAAAVLRTTLEPHALLSLLHAIEDAHGRRRTVRWGPRTLDLDLLLYGDRVLVTPGLTVPHPRMTSRGFVLAPLSEVAPTLRHPPTGRTVADLYATWRQETTSTPPSRIAPPPRGEQEGLA